MIATIAENEKKARGSALIATVAVNRRFILEACYFLVYVFLYRRIIIIIIKQKHRLWFREIFQRRKLGLGPFH